MIYEGIHINWLWHSSFLIKASFGKIYIDPFKIPDSYAEDIDKEAEVIFITHSHYDHCSIEDIKKIVKHGTIIICPADVSSKFSKIDKKLDIKIAEPGTTMEFFDSDLRFWTIPAYNNSGRFHSREDEWNGYVIQADGVKIYHAGDCDLINEMKTLLNMAVDIALLPVGGTFTMNAGEAAKAASIIKPRLAIPMHWGTIQNTGDKKEAELFLKYCSSYDINAKILEIEAG